MDFGYALQAMREGLKVSRSGWNGKDMWIVLMPELSLPPFSSQAPGAKVNDRTAKHIGENTPLESQPYFTMWTAKKQWQPGWLASQADMLADDWDTVKEQRAMEGGDTCGEEACKEACKEAGEKKASGEEKGEEVAV